MPSSILDGAVSTDSHMVFPPIAALKSTCDLEAALLPIQVEGVNGVNLARAQVRLRSSRLLQERGEVPDPGMSCLGINEEGFAGGGRAGKGHDLRHVVPLTRDCL